MSMQPLTTILTPPSSCLASTAAYEIHTNGTQYHLWGPQGLSSECFPSGYTKTLNGVFSPGVCPYRYTPACQRQTFTLASVTETRDVCCPDIGEFTCGPTITSNFAGPWQSTLGCVMRYTTPLTMPALQEYTVGEATTTTTRSKVVLTPSGTGRVYAFSVQVAWQEKDHMTPAPTNNTPGEGRGDSDSGGLDKGAQIGIGVSLGVLFVLIVAGVFLLFRRRRQGKEDGKSIGGLNGYGYAGVSSNASTAPSPSPEAFWSAYPGVAHPSPKTTPPGHGISGIALGHTGALPPVELPPDNNKSHSPVQRGPIVEVMGDSLPPGSTYLR